MPCPVKSVRMPYPPDDSTDAWTADPTSFRPDTRMPQFFGLHEHLDGRGLADARRFEAVEIRAINAYLLSSSESLDVPEPPAGITEPASLDRGEQLFMTHGCVACHRHKDFPQGESTFGPDLTNLGSKLDTEAGAKWLADWIRDPAHYSPRTLMPNALLEPVPRPSL